MAFIHGEWKVQRVKDNEYVNLPAIEPTGQGFYHLVEKDGTTYAWQGGDVMAIDVKELFSSKESQAELAALDKSEDEDSNVPEADEVEED